MEEKEKVDQAILAEDLSKQIKYSFLDFFLVKPLDPIKVKKEFSKPVPTGTPAKDENGIEAQDFDSVETEVKEVDSDFRRGIVGIAQLADGLFFVDHRIEALLTD